MAELSTKVAAIAVDFDGDSSRPASSGNNFFWRTRPELRVSNEISREWGYYAPAALELAAQSTYKKGEVPLLLGGGHSLSYWMVRAAVREYGPLNMIVFDAHHDRYFERRLSHYSVMNRIQSDFPVALVPIGNRFEDESATQLMREPFDGAPWYISVDVDYFSPQVVASVMHSVETSGETLDVDSIRHELKAIPVGSPIVGADIVEWMHSRSTDEEIEVVEQLLTLILSTLEKQSCK